MKRLLFAVALCLGVGQIAVNAQNKTYQDDIYYSGSDAKKKADEEALKEKQYQEELARQQQSQANQYSSSGNSYDSDGAYSNYGNSYQNDGYVDYDDDPFAYSSYIRRFNYPFYNMGYYSAFYNPWWYDPFWGPGFGWNYWNSPAWGIGWGYGGPYWSSYWGWYNWYGYPGFYSCYNYPLYGGWGGWGFGNYYSGYWNGYYAGLYNSYYPRYRTVTYGPRYTMNAGYNGLRSNITRAQGSMRVAQPNNNKVTPYTPGTRIGSLESPRSGNVRADAGVREHSIRNNRFPEERTTGGNDRMNTRTPASGVTAQPDNGRRRSFSEEPNGMGVSEGREPMTPRYEQRGNEQPRQQPAYRQPGRTQQQPRPEYRQPQQNQTPRYTPDRGGSRNFGGDRGGSSFGGSRSPGGSFGGGSRGVGSSGGGRSFGGGRR